MIKTKKQMFLIIASFVLVILLGTVTYAFFNYTRTGTSNIIKTGRIYFNSEEGSSINLDNVFPIDKANISTDIDNVGSVSIHITGDTTYSNGIEYLVTAVNVKNSVEVNNNTKKIPISVDVSYEETTDKTIGELDKDYFENRGGNSSIYKVLAGKKVDEGNKLLVGYIKPGATGVDGTITIKAYIDKDNIAITDTYPEGNYSETIGQNAYEVNQNITNNMIEMCEEYLYGKGYSSYLDYDETLENYCSGTGTLSGKTIQGWLDSSWFYSDDITNLKQIGILVQTSFAITNSWTNGTTNDWVNGRTYFTTEEWNSLQTNGISFQIKVEANEGIWVDKQGNAMNTFPTRIYNSNISSNIKEIYFNEMDSALMHQRYDSASIKADLTYNNEGEVLSWLETNSEDNTKYIMYIASDGETFLTTGQSLFYFVNSAEKIVFNNVNTSRVTTMQYMFQLQNNLKELDLRSFDTSNVVNMNSFIYRTPIERINMSGLDLRKVKDMSNMFYSNFSLETIDLSNVQTRDVENMVAMFYGCSKLTDIDLEGFGGDNLNSINNMFAQNYEMKTINMKNFNFGKVTSLQSLFANMSNLETVNLSNANMPKNETLGYLFEGCSKLMSVNLSNINTSSLTNISNMFLNCNLLTDVNFTNFDTSSVVQMHNMFNGCTNLVELDLSSFNTSNVENFYNMFNNALSLETIYVSNLWTTDSVNTPGYTQWMFEGCTSLVGGNGTTYDSNKKDYTMAVIDTPSTPGYLTNIVDKPTL